MRSGDKRQRYAFYLILPNEFMPNLAKKSKFGMNSTYNELLNSKIKAVYMNTKSVRMPLIASRVWQTPKPQYLPLR